jgi:hypothetical protein
MASIAPKANCSRRTKHTPSPRKEDYPIWIEESVEIRIHQCHGQHSSWALLMVCIKPETQSSNPKTWHPNQFNPNQIPEVVSWVSNIRFKLWWTGGATFLLTIQPRVVSQSDSFSQLSTCTWTCLHLMHQLINKITWHATCIHARLDSPNS